MTLNAYFLRHGRAGLRALALATGARFGYLQQLNYVTRKKPSMALALKLVAASGGEITLDGLANPVKVLKRPRRTTPEMDAQIQRLYADGIGHGEVRRFAAAAGVSRQHLHNRAKALGVRRPRANRWSPEEIALLAQHDDLGSEEIQHVLRAAGYHRTCAAISTRRTTEATAPTIATIARRMGVDEAVVGEWIRSSGLPARDGRVSREDLAAWMQRSRDWDHRLCAKSWLVKMLARGG